jgi:hypothetical protein
MSEGKIKLRYNTDKCLFVDIKDREIISKLNDLGFKGYEWYAKATQEDLKRARDNYSLVSGTPWPQRIYASYSSMSLHEPWGGNFKEYDNIDEMITEIKQEIDNINDDKIYKINKAIHRCYEEIAELGRKRDGIKILRKQGKVR